MRSDDLKECLVKLLPDHRLPDQLLCSNFVTGGEQRKGTEQDAFRPARWELEVRKDVRRDCEARGRVCISQGSRR